MLALGRFLRNRSGHFGMMTAILAVPLIGAVGIALDFAHAFNVRTQLMGASDATALASISQGSHAFNAASRLGKDGAVEFDQTSVGGMFIANAAQFVAITAEDFTIDVHKTGDDVTSTVNFSVDVPTFFMHFLGQKTITISGRATASYAAGGPNFVDFHLLLDNSPSMGLGATIRDINALIAKTDRKCAFACHEVWNSGVENTNSFYHVARRNGIRLRIDVLRDSVLELVDHADDLQGNSNAFRFAAYTFGKHAQASGHRIDKVAPLSANLPLVRQAVSDVTLMSTPHSTYNEDALTSFDNAFTSVGAEIKTDGGTGRTTNDREQVLLIVTDGVGNSIKPGQCTGLFSGSKYRCIEPMDLRLCDDLKKRNIKIAILYTTYVPIDDHLYNTYVKKFAGQIAPKLKDCASPDLFSEVGIDGDMEAAIKTLFGKAAVSKSLRLVG